jgi:methyl-accepting chemotaxis protein
VSGPYRQSGLAEAYKNAKGLSTGQVYFTQFEPYTPSYEAATAFASSPIYEDGTLVGVLVFQMPVDQINRVMTFNGDWDAQDMGESAEVYLVDSRRRILNNRRQFQEDKEGFLGVLYDLEFNEDLITQIDVYDTTAGILPINSPAVDDALGDGEGFLTFTDYRNVEVMSAFAPLDFAGMNWVILSEVDVEEALEPVAFLRSTLLVNVVIFALGALVLSVGLGVWIARSITNPIQLVSERVQQVARELDFREQLPEEGDHELKELAVSVNTLVSGLRDNLSSVLEATHKLSSNAEDIKSMTGDIAQAAEQQAQESTMVATAATEMQSTSQEVARNAATTADNTRDSLTSAQQAQKLSANSSEMSEVLSAEMEHVSGLLQQVAKESESIGAVLDVINGIAEQTNLLALNAAIEAARAGEQGRGFAVVADEVRQLAQRTQSATTEIDQMISSLQGRSQEAVTAMEKDKQITAEFVTGSQNIADAIGHVAELVSSIADMNIQVATAAEEQTSVVDEISHNAETISEVAGLNSERSSRLLSNADQLDQLAKQLQDVVANYQV